MNAEVVLTRPAYSVKEWAQACGVGEDAIRSHINNSRLIARYPTRKAIIFVEDGLEWLRSLPTEAAA